MTWSAAEAALDGILARRWYTNHGPSAEALERRVAETLDTRHAVAVTNPTIGLVMLAEALDLGGDVLLSPEAPLRCRQALSWAGLRGVSDESDGAVAVLLSDSPDRARLWDLAWDRGLPVLSDGVAEPGVPAVIRLPGDGDDAGAGCVLTDDDRLAARLRNIRSSYGAGPAVTVRRTANGRLSEAQAAMSLLAWDRQHGPGAG